MTLVEATLGLVAVLSVGVLGSYALDRLLWGRAGVRGYWTRALLMVTVFGAGVWLLFIRPYF